MTTMFVPRSRVTGSETIAAAARWFGNRHSEVKGPILEPFQGRTPDPSAQTPKNKARRASSAFRRFLESFRRAARSGCAGRPAALDRNRSPGGLQERRLAPQTDDHSRMLQARTTFPSDQPADLIVMLCQRMAERYRCEMDDRATTIIADHARAVLKVAPGAMVIEIEALDAVGLSYMKIELGEHLAALLGEPLTYRWVGDGGGSRVPFLRPMRVERSERLCARFQRIVLRGDDLASFATGGMHVRLLFPRNGRRPVWPTLAPSGRLVWPSGADRLDARVYTIRTIDPGRGRIEIDIVRHEGAHTPGGRFAEQARPGDMVGMLGPGGGAIPIADRMIVLGDDTALPAIARICEETPANRTIAAFVASDATDYHRSLDERARGRITLLPRGGKGGEARLSAHLSEAICADPANAPYIWSGCEFAEFQRIRRVVRGEWRVPKDRHLVVSYWRHGHAADG